MASENEKQEGVVELLLDYDVVAATSPDTRTRAFRFPLARAFSSYA
jgi:hypothetical protein